MSAFLETFDFTEAPARPAVLAWAGRLDNLKELRGLLGMEPSSVEELILAAYEKWEEGMLGRLRGDFSFALWDPSRRRLVAGRDAFGVQPFFYHWDGARFSFGSDVAAVVEKAAVAKRPDAETVAGCLAGDFQDPAATFFAGIRQLPGGHYLILRDGSPAVRRYFVLEPSERKELEGGECLARYLHLFKQAVHRRLHGGPALVFLSGGIDSSAVCAAALDARGSDGSVSALTWLADGFLVEERDRIRRLEEKFGLTVGTFAADDMAGSLFENYMETGCWPHYHGILPDGLFDRAQAAVEAAGKEVLPARGPWRIPDADIGVRYHGRGCTSLPVVTPPGAGGQASRPPFGDASAVRGAVEGGGRASSPPFGDALAARGAGARIVLTGYGADELSQRLEQGFLEDLFWSGRFREFGRAAAGHARAYAMEPAPARYAAELLRGALRRLARERALPPRPRSRHAVWSELTSPSLGFSLNQIHDCGFRRGLEVRHPFLDRDLVEFFLSVPAEIKMSHGFRKMFFQKALEPLLGSPSPVEDPRPIAPAADGRLERGVEERRIRRDFLRSPLLFEFVEKRRVERLAERYFSGKGPPTDRNILWKICRLEKWLDDSFGRSPDGGGDARPPASTASRAANAFPDGGGDASLKGA